MFHTDKNPNTGSLPFFSFFYLYFCAVWRRRRSLGKARMGAKQSFSLPGSSQTGAVRSRCARLASSLQTAIQTKTGWARVHVVRAVSGCCRSLVVKSMFRRSDDKTVRVHHSSGRRKKLRLARTTTTCTSTSPT